MKKFEQRESKRGTEQAKHGEVRAKEIAQGYRADRTWRSLSIENQRGVQDRQNMEKIVQRESKRGTG
jgi:hypothetical protein